MSNIKRTTDEDIDNDPSIAHYTEEEKAWFKTFVKKGEDHSLQAHGTTEFDSTCETCRAIMDAGFTTLAEMNGLNLE